MCEFNKISTLNNKIFVFLDICDIWMDTLHFVDPYIDVFCINIL